MRMTERAGFQREGVARAWDLHHDGVPVDCVVYLAPAHRRVGAAAGRWSGARSDELAPLDHRRLDRRRDRRRLADQAVAHPDDPIAGLADLAVVGHQDERLAVLAIEPSEQREDLGRSLRVEVAGRLVGQDQPGLVDERPGDRDPLLLAARQLGRSVAVPVGEPDEVERLARRRLRRPRRSIPA